MTTLMRFAATLLCAIALLLPNSARADERPSKATISFKLIDAKANRGLYEVRVDGNLTKADLVALQDSDAALRDTIAEARANKADISPAVSERWTKTKAGVWSLNLFSKAPTGFTGAKSERVVLAKPMTPDAIGGKVAQPNGRAANQSQARAATAGEAAGSVIQGVSDKPLVAVEHPAATQAPSAVETAMRNGTSHQNAGAYAARDASVNNPFAEKTPSAPDAGNASPRAIPERFTSARSNATGAETVNDANHIGNASPRAIPERFTSARSTSTAGAETVSFTELPAAAAPERKGVGYKMGHAVGKVAGAGFATGRSLNQHFRSAIASVRTGAEAGFQQHAAKAPSATEWGRHAQPMTARPEPHVARPMQAPVQPAHR